jgi:hypothetical protein
VNIYEALWTTAFDKIFADDPKACVVLRRESNGIDFARIRRDEPISLGQLWLDDLKANDWRVRVEWSAKP